MMGNDENDHHEEAAPSLPQHEMDVDLGSGDPLMESGISVSSTWDFVFVPFRHFFGL
jgi:hypothetical protein